MPRQLRVRDLVVVRAPDRWPVRSVLAPKEVGVPEPSAVEEGRLEDDVDARGHGFDRLSRLPPQPIATLLVLVALDRRHPEPSIAQIGEVASLMLESAPADDVELAILAHRLRHETRQRRPLERGEVLAGQVADEVGCREDGLAVDQLHRCVCDPLIRPA